jgi:hypothetical protein
LSQPTRAAIQATITSISHNEYKTPETLLCNVPAAQPVHALASVPWTCCNHTYQPHISPPQGAHKPETSSTSLPPRARSIAWLTRHPLDKHWLHDIPPECSKGHASSMYYWLSTSVPCSRHQHIPNKTEQQVAGCWVQTLT